MQVGEDMPKTEQKPSRKRLTVDMSIEEHQRLKLAAVQAGVSMREFVMALLTREGIITAES
jgi:predicted HicB family RNase H-like nuclease